MRVKAKFSKILITNKAVMTFELDEACAGSLPELATMAGMQVLLDVDQPQQRIHVDAEVEDAEGLVLYG